MNYQKYIKMIRSIWGWHHVEDFFSTAHILEHVLKKRGLNEVNFIEIGIFNGRSFLPIAHYFYDKITTFYACDTFEDPPQVGIFKSHLNRFLPADYSKKVNILKEDSLKLASRFPNGVDSMKFIYCSIDGHHTYEHTRSDLEFCAERLHDGGIILLDDVYQASWPEVGNAMYDFLREHKEFNAVFILTNKVILSNDKDLANELYDPTKFDQQKINGATVNIAKQGLVEGWWKRFKKSVNDRLNNTPKLD